MQEGRVVDDRIINVIIENINKALSHNKETRECAEKTLKSFEISPGNRFSKSIPNNKV